MTVGKKQTKKQTIISRLFKECQRRGTLTFDNEMVKTIAREIGFKNPFDATKVDRSNLLPDDVRDADYYILHLGKGRHRFVKGLKVGYHSFEPITDGERIPWKYRPSVLNELDTSESNILSVASNQRLLHDFLYEDLVASPKVYNARRTKLSFSFWAGKEYIKTAHLQMEIDMTLEYQRVVTVIEGKNGFPPDFAVYQIYFPFRYYHILNQQHDLGLERVQACYILRRRRGKQSTLRLYLYTFDDIDNMASIRLLKKAEYTLLRR